MTTKIEWADVVWNPTVGCTPASAGCAHCYAKRMFNRNMSYHSHTFEHPTTYPERLGMPFHWKRPRRIFVDSMSDLFHPDIPFSFIDDVFAVMTGCTQHTFMILTKRPERMLEFTKQYYLPGAEVKNIWLGVSAENQETADERIPFLMQCPAAIRFVSIEPMLGPVVLHVNVYPVDWVICGGETGVGHRPIKINWVQSLRNQCHSVDISFFFKGWGGTNKKKSGRLLDGREWNQYPEVK